MMKAPAAGLQTGGIFNDRYEIVRCIRAGGMGAVYEVVDKKTRRRRALKVMLPSIAGDPEFRARFQREATVTADIESEHIVETFDADVDVTTGAPFLVMELLKGEDLGQILERLGGLTPQEVVPLLRQAAMALDRTHAAGVIHRDLKPENLFITRTDDGIPKLKVLDFGIAKVVESSADARNTRMLGTPLYMAPEQIRGDVPIGPAVDLYALGHIAFSLLVGEAYWAQDGVDAPAMYALLSRMLLGAEEPAGARALRRRGVALPPGLNGWFARATAVAPEQRYTSASTMILELAEALDVSIETRAVLERSAPRPTPTPAPPPRESATPSEPTKLSGPQGTEAIHSGLGSWPVPPSAVSSGTTTTPVSETRGATIAPNGRRTAPIGIAVVGLVGALGVAGLGLHLRQAPAPVGSSAAATLTVDPPTSPLSSSAPLNEASPESAPTVEPVPDEPPPSKSATASPLPAPKAKQPTPKSSQPAHSPPTASPPLDPTRTR